MQQEEELKWLRQHAYAVHLWNKYTIKVKVEPGSLMEKIFKQSCVLCDDSHTS